MARQGLVGNLRRSEPQRPRLQELAPGAVERPLDLDRHPEHLLRPQEQAAELAALRRIEAGARRAGRSSGVLLVRASGAVLRPARLGAEKDHVDRMLRAVALRPSQGEALLLPAKQVAIGHHLALRDRGTEAGRSAEEHLPGGGAAQPSAGRARGDEWLDEDRHRRLRRIDAARGPAGAARRAEASSPKCASWVRYASASMHVPPGVGSPACASAARLAALGPNRSESAASSESSGTAIDARSLIARGPRSRRSDRPP